MENLLNNLGRASCYSFTAAYVCGAALKCLYYCCKEEAVKQTIQNVVLSLTGHCFSYLLP